MDQLAMPGPDGNAGAYGGNSGGDQSRLAELFGGGGGWSSARNSGKLAQSQPDMQ